MNTSKKIPNKKEALSFFFSYFPNYKKYKYTIKQIHSGFTNYSFLLTVQKNKTRIEKFQIRLANNNDIVNRENELNVLNAIKNEDFLVLLENGDGIKKWFEGRNIPKKEVDELFLIKLNKEINKIQNCKVIQNILKQDYFEFFEDTKHNFTEEQNNIYKELLSRNTDTTLVLCHNDLNLDNILLLENKKIKLIDFEWSRINYFYWDYANFIRETNLSLKLIKLFCKMNKKINLKKLFDFLYICTHFALQWSFKTHETNKIYQYRKNNFKLLNKYLQLIKKGDKNEF